MAKHNVYFSLPKRELSNSDIIIEVYSDEEKFGTITISKGMLEWYPASAKNPYRMDWEYFDKVVKSYFDK
jgi:hypothetical protein